MAGAQAVSPVLLGVVPFAMISCAAAVGVGLPQTESMLMSLILYAGASQLAAVKLMGEHAPVWVIVLTGLLINLRFVMYSASIAPHLRHVGPLQRLAMTWILSDQAYAVSVARFQDNPPRNEAMFYFGAAVAMWSTWQVGSLAGILLGAEIPASWGLDFAIPLTFTALVVPVLRDRLAGGVAVLAGVLAIVASGLPFNLGLPVAALGAIACGVIVERTSR
jgi:4-azaleucine resistance transporter AzlC